jgi:hypothetical protein
MRAAGRVLLETLTDEELCLLDSVTKKLSAPPSRMPRQMARKIKQKQSQPSKRLGWRWRMPQQWRHADNVSASQVLVLQIQAVTARVARSLQGKGRNAILDCSGTEVTGKATNRAQQTTKVS